MTPRQVISIYYRIAGLNTLAASLVWGINTLFLLGSGLDLAQVFLVGAVATSAIVLFEVPTGAVADARGRRLSLLLSAALSVLSTLLYLLAGHVGGMGLFCFGAVVQGLGTSFFSGAAEAWLVDEVERAGHREALAAVLARAQLVTGGTTCLGSLAGGLLAEMGLAVPYLVRAALLAGLYLFVLRVMEEPGFSPRPLAAGECVGELNVLARSSLAIGLGQAEVRALLLAGFLWYGFLAWAFHAWQPWLLELLARNAPWVVGVVSTLVTLATLAGNALVDRLARRGTEDHRPLLLAMGLQCVGAIGLGLATSFASVLALLLLVSAASGMVGPLKQALLHHHVPSEQRATVLSLDSLFGNGGAVVGQAALGVWARDRGIPQAYLVGGLFTLLALPLLARARPGRR